MLRPTVYYLVHSWIFNNCQTFFRTTSNVLTKYMTKCLPCELPPDYGGVLLSAKEQCWQGELAPDRDPQGKLILGEGTKKVQSEKRLLKSQVSDQDRALWIRQQNCFPCDSNPDKQMIKDAASNLVRSTWMCGELLICCCSAFVLQSDNKFIGFQWIVPFCSRRHSASPAAALSSANTVSHMVPRQYKM